jgi:hypothetical protein
MPVVKWSVSGLLFASVLSSLGYCATPDRITGALNNGQTVALVGSVHRQALPQFDQGPADPALQFGSITLLTFPSVAQRNALTQLVSEQQDPHSRNYHKWLTPEQWADRFGLSLNDVARITDWLESEGFSNVQVARGRNWITFSGTAAQVASAFNTEIHSYNVNGQMHAANATALNIPAALSGIVSGIRGLNDFHLQPRVIHRIRPNYHSSSLQAQFLAPGDIATLYDINALYGASTPVDGTGQKLAIIGQTDVYLADINDFRTGFGLSSIGCTTNASGVITACSDPHLQYVVADNLTDPQHPLTTGDLSEADLDLEWSGAVARGAQLVYVNAPATFSGNNLVSGGVWEAWYWAVDNQLAPVISMSYGLCEFGNPNIMDPTTGMAGSDEVELQKANSFGITFVNSSGDTGATECDNQTTSAEGNLAVGGYAAAYPASSPEVTGTGGNSISVAELNDGTYWGKNNGTNGGSVLDPPGYIPEQAWNDDAELAAFCAADPSNSLCKQGGQNPARGWIPITNATTAQADIGISASGGGSSNCAMQNSEFTACVSGFPKPAWQTVKIPGQSNARFTPDVSFLASPNFPGYVFCTELSELNQAGTGSSCATGVGNSVDKYNSIIGGTSVSAPIFAGIVTLLNQSLNSTGLGNVNPTLYRLAASPSNGAFHQVISGSNVVACKPGTPGSPQPTALDCPSGTSPQTTGMQASNADAITGYNLVSGLGSVDVNKLAIAWAAATTVNFSLSASTPSPASISAGNSTTSTITVTPQNGFTGTVAFSCPSAPTGVTCTANSVAGGTGTTTLTIATQPDIAANIYTLTVTGSSGGASSSTSVAITVTATTQSFTLVSNPTIGTLSVRHGSSVPINLVVTSNNGFVTSTGGNSQAVLPLSYSCSGLPSQANCLFNPNSPTAAGTVTLTITTIAPTVGRLQPFIDGNRRIFYAALVPGLFGLILLSGTRRRSLRGIHRFGLVAILALSTLWLGSCGKSSNSSNSDPGTPAGNYSITVNATTGGAKPIANSFSFILNVTN